VEACNLVVVGDSRAVEAYSRAAAAVEGNRVAGACNLVVMGDSRAAGACNQAGTVVGDNPAAGPCSLVVGECNVADQVLALMREWLSHNWDR
jgi:hypothetical protein